VLVVPKLIEQPLGDPVLLLGRWRPVAFRPAQPEEIALAFVFFASEADSSYVTGEVLTLLGGKMKAA
jgi:NAD(P)-dependent dehydrogenase (short-subunit alcohol dehydrogenase family)